MMSQVIECYQFSCQFAVHISKVIRAKNMPLILSNTPYQNSLKWLWTDLKTNSSTGFQNVDSTRVVIKE